MVSVDFLELKNAYLYLVTQFQYHTKNVVNTHSERSYLHSNIKVIWWNYQTFSEHCAVTDIPITFWEKLLQQRMFTLEHCLWQIPKQWIIVLIQKSTDVVCDLIWKAEMLIKFVQLRKQIVGLSSGCEDECENATVSEDFGTIHIYSLL
jgi:hypothetical protein